MAGLSGINLYDPRHFYASGLIAAGGDVVTVQRALGHSSPTTTLKTDSHLGLRLRTASKAAGAMLTEATGSAAAEDSVRTDEGS